MRGPTMFSGYYKQPDMTAEAVDKDGFFHTGELCVLSMEGVHVSCYSMFTICHLSTGSSRFAVVCVWQLVHAATVHDPEARSYGLCLYPCRIMQVTLVS